MSIFHSDVMNLNVNSAVAYLTFKKLDEYVFLNHAFSTRLGGVSKGKFKSMNLVLKRGDEEESVKENYKLFCLATNFSLDSLVVPNLTHSKNIGVAKRENMGSGGLSLSNFPNTDGLITNQPGVTIATSHADCPAIFILDPVKRAIGLLHAGWRGTVQEIAREGIEKMHDEFGCISQNLICCISPAINKCCFQVGEEVINRVKEMGHISLNDVIFERENKYYVDLYEINRQILINSGVKKENIILSDLCTMCNKDLFFSHRATQGERGGMLAMMGLREKY